MKALFFLIFITAVPAWAQLKVVTTTPTLATLVKAIGQDAVEVKSLTKVNQDPHHIDAKPSFMVAVRKADLVVSVGMDLEVGWLPLVLRGARKPKLLDENVGHFVAGHFIEPLDVPSGKIDRSQGDIHPEGNPHYYLDPHEIKKVIEALSERLVSLSPSKKEAFLKNASDYASQIDEKMALWQARVKNSNIEGAITYHKTMRYFMNRFGLKLFGTIEPKPGVPPTAKHTLSLINKAKARSFVCILNENLFETTAAKRIKKETTASIQVVPVEAEKDYVSFIDNLIGAVEACGKDKAKWKP